MFRNLFPIGDKHTFSLYLSCAKQGVILERFGLLLDYSKRQDNTEKQLLPNLLCLKVENHNKSRSNLSAINKINAAIHSPRLGLE